MFDQGDVAKMGPYAFTVYSVIKSHANYHTGISSPSIETIAEKAGMSCSQVKRELDVLESAGYLARTKSGRSNLYTLIENIEVTNKDGETEALTSWSYIPKRTSAAVGQLKRSIGTGDLSSKKLVTVRPITPKADVREPMLKIKSDARIEAFKNRPFHLQKSANNRVHLRLGVIHSSE
jgi:hypothetical protein